MSHEASWVDLTLAGLLLTAWVAVMMGAFVLPDDDRVLVHRAYSYHQCSRDEPPDTVEVDGALIVGARQAAVPAAALRLTPALCGAVATREYFYEIPPSSLGQARQLGFDLWMGTISPPGSAQE